MVDRQKRICALGYQNLYEKGQCPPITLKRWSGTGILGRKASDTMMENRAWWITLLQWTLWGVIMLIVTGWLGKSRFRAWTASRARCLVHPPSTLIIGLVCFAFFAGIAVVSNVIPNETTTWWTTSAFVGFALLSVAMVFGFFLEKHEVSEEGIACRNFAGARKYLRWSDLRAVRYASAMKWFRLETNSGSVARISVVLTGLPEFARLLLQSAPQGAIDAGTLDVLRATAAGKPPSVWM
jgi:hypothetical protein